MEIYRVRISKEMLRALPPSERDFMLLAGHMLNELNALRKAYAWAVVGHRDHLPFSPLEGTISSATSMIYARLLAGKECEAWESGYLFPSPATGRPYTTITRA